MLGLARSSADALFAMTHPAIVLDIQPQGGAKDCRHMPRQWGERYAQWFHRFIDQFEGEKLEVRRIKLEMVVVIWS